MATTIKQSEAIPASYPDAPAGLSTAAAALDADMIWQRIESYVAHRWTERAVVWTVEGPNEWTPPLTPATISTVEIWNGTAWETCTEPDSPLGGYWLSGEGPYRFTATVGGGSPAPTVPASVNAAFARLAEYMAEDTGKAGASNEKTSVGPIDLDVSRNPAWMARAMINSGAGDLLRQFRRA
ncbi:hypothetical protein [Hoeflea sp.]|uniref:hypothetical protein n=1 Tax=Hoeflea sp. TaxID=1940281 RepID=UPI003A9515BD